MNGNLQRENWTRNGTPYLREAVKQPVLTSYLRRNTVTRSDADKVDGLSKWTYSCGGHAPANGSAARYRSSPFHSSSSSSFAIRPLPRVFTFFFFKPLSFPLLSFSFQCFFFSLSLSYASTYDRGIILDGRKRNGVDSGCNSRDAVNAALRRKSRPFFHGNARVNV